MSQTTMTYQELLEALGIPYTGEGCDVKFDPSGIDVTLTTENLTTDECVALFQCIIESATTEQLVEFLTKLDFSELTDEQKEALAQCLVENENVLNILNENIKVENVENLDFTNLSAAQCQAILDCVLEHITPEQITKLTQVINPEEFTTAQCVAILECLIENGTVQNFTDLLQKFDLTQLTGQQCTDLALLLVSADAGNAITIGTDNKLLLSSATINITEFNFTLLTAAQCQAIFDCLCDNATDAQITKFVQRIDFSTLTNEQIEAICNALVTSLVSSDAGNLLGLGADGKLTVSSENIDVTLIDFTTLAPDQCRTIFQCICDHMTAAQVETLLGKFDFSALTVGQSVQIFQQICDNATPAQREKFLQQIDFSTLTNAQIAAICVAMAGELISTDPDAGLVLGTDGKIKISQSVIAGIGVFSINSIDLEYNANNELVMTVSVTNSDGTTETFTDPTPIPIQISITDIDLTELTEAQCRTIFQCIIDNGTTAQFKEFFDKFDTSTLTNQQCVDLVVAILSADGDNILRPGTDNKLYADLGGNAVQVLNFNNLTAAQCQTIFDCVIANGTTQQFIDFLQKLDFTQLTQTQCQAIASSIVSTAVGNQISIDATGKLFVAQDDDDDDIHEVRSLSTNFTLFPTAPGDNVSTRTYHWTGNTVGQGIVSIPAGSDPSTERWWVHNDSPNGTPMTIDASAVLSGLSPGSATTIPAGCKADISYDEFGEEVFVHVYGPLSKLDMSSLTTQQITQLQTALGPLLTINAGPTASSTDDANGSQDVTFGDTVHFTSSDSTLEFTISAGSAVVDGKVAPSALTGGLRLIPGTNQIEIVNGEGNAIGSPVDLTPYIDDTNLARLISGTLDANTGILTVTRDDTSTFEIDLSAFLSAMSVRWIKEECYLEAGSGATQTVSVAIDAANNAGYIGVPDYNALPAAQRQLPLVNEAIANLPALASNIQLTSVTIWMNANDQGNQTFNNVTSGSNGAISSPAGGLVRANQAHTFTMAGGTDEAVGDEFSFGGIVNGVRQVQMNADGFANHGFELSYVEAAKISVRTYEDGSMFVVDKDANTLTALATVPTDWILTSCLTAEDEARVVGIIDENKRINDFVEVRERAAAVTVPGGYTLLRAYTVTVTNDDGSTVDIAVPSAQDADTTAQAVSWAAAFNANAGIFGTWAASGDKITASDVGDDPLVTKVTTLISELLTFNSGNNPVEVVIDKTWQITDGDLTAEIDLGTANTLNEASGGNGILAGESVLGVPDTFSISSTAPGWVAPDRLQLRVNDLDPGPGEFIEFGVAPLMVEPAGSTTAQPIVTGSRVDPAVNNTDILASFGGGITSMTMQQREFVGGTNRIGYRDVGVEWDFVSEVDNTVGQVNKLIRCGETEFTDMAGNPVDAPTVFVSCGTYAALDELEDRVNAAIESASTGTGTGSPTYVPQYICKAGPSSQLADFGSSGLNVAFSNAPNGSPVDAEYYVMYTAENRSTRFAASPPNYPLPAQNLAQVYLLNGDWFYQMNDNGPASHIQFTPESTDLLVASARPAGQDLDANGFQNNPAFLLVNTLTAGTIGGIPTVENYGGLTVVNQALNLATGPVQSNTEMYVTGTLSASSGKVNYVLQLDGTYLGDDGSTVTVQEVLDNPNDYQVV